MGRAAGHIIIVSPDRPIEEHDTLQCVHCDGHWVVDPGSGRQRGWCMNCGGPHCGAKGCWECIPFTRKIEQSFQRQKLLEALTR